MTVKASEGRVDRVTTRPYPKNLPKSRPNWSSSRRVLHDEPVIPPGARDSAASKIGGSLVSADGVYIVCAIRCDRTHLLFQGISRTSAPRMRSRGSKLRHEHVIASRRDQCAAAHIHRAAHASAKDYIVLRVPGDRPGHLTRRIAENLGPLRSVIRIVLRDENIAEPGARLKTEAKVDRGTDLTGEHDVAQPIDREPIASLNS